MWIVFTFRLAIFLFFSFSFSNFFQLHAHFVLYLNFRFLSNSILVVLIKAIKYPVSSGTLWLTQKSNCYFDTAWLFHTIEVAVHRSNKVAGMRISGKPEKKLITGKKVWLVENTWNICLEISWHFFLRQKQPPEVFYNIKGVLRNFAKFTGKHLCQSLFLLKKRPWHRCFPVNFAKLLHNL